MSDLILGAIIGGLIGLVSSVSTLLIQGHYSKTTTKMQIDARVEELRRQFEYQQKQAQTERLTGLRTQYLAPIGQRLKSITELAHRIEGKVRDLVMLCGNDEIIPWAYSHSSGLLDDMRDSVKHIGEHMDAIEMLRTQNTDSHLATLVQKALILGEQGSKEISELRNMYCRHGEGDFSDRPVRQTSPLGWVQALSARPSDMNDEPNKQISYQCIRSLEMINALFESIRQTNRRIEEIMSGME